MCGGKKNDQGVYEGKYGADAVYEIQGTQTIEEFVARLVETINKNKGVKGLLGDPENGDGFVLRIEIWDQGNSPHYAVPVKKVKK